VELMTCFSAPGVMIVPVWLGFRTLVYENSGVPREDEVGVRVISVKMRHCAWFRLTSWHNKREPECTQWVLGVKRLGR